MTDRLLIALLCGLVGWQGLFPSPPTPKTIHEKMVERSHSKVCEKKKLKAKIKALCKRWGYD